MNIEDDLSHPFKFFGLAVTRNLTAIKSAIEAKYKSAKKDENHEDPLRRAVIKQFNKYVLLIAEPDLRSGTGIYKVDQVKIEKIIERCVPKLDDYMKSMVQPATNIIHPDQIALAIQQAREMYNIDRDVAEPYMDGLIKARNWKVSRDTPPPPPVIQANPIRALGAQILAGQIHLHWTLPADRCDNVIVARSEKGPPTVNDKIHQFLGKEWPDNHVEPGKQYHYGVYSLFGQSQPVAGPFLTVCARGRIEVEKAIADSGTALLTWKALPNVKRTLVFRSRGPLRDIVDMQGALALPAQAEVIELGQVDSYQDKFGQPGETWFYTVAVHHKCGVYSTSESRPIQFTPPPSATSDMTANVVPGKVYTSWKKVTGADIQYCLTRSVTPDREASDGETKQWLLKGSNHADKDVIPGCSYWYFVTTERRGIRSPHVASVGPVVAIAEVAKLTAQASDGKVTLNWDAPVRAKRVEVRRDGGKESDKPIRVASPPGLVDRDVVNNTRYVYRVRCVFVDKDGKEVVTPGEAVEATPSASPSVIGDFQASYANHKFGVRWEKAAPNSVEVVRVSAIPSFNVGDSIDTSSLEQMGKIINRSGESEAADFSPSAKDPFYLIFAVNRFRATFCGFVQYVEMAWVSARLEDQKVVIEWPWPSGSSLAEIGLLQRGTLRSAKRVSRRGAASVATMTVPVSKLPHGEHTFLVRCVIDPKSRIQGAAGPGVSATIQLRRPLPVSWELERNGDGVDLIITCVSGLAGVTRLTLNGRINRLPESSTDGQCRAELRCVPSMVRNVEHRLTLAPWPVTRGRVYHRLFAEPPDAVVIEQPSLDRSTI